MVLTRRRLPRLYLENTPLFLTWHLYGSLPHKLYPPPGKQNSGKAFVWMDRYLDSARTGPLFLRQEAIARLLVESSRYSRFGGPNRTTTRCATSWRAGESGLTLRTTP